MVIQFHYFENYFVHYSKYFPIILKFVVVDFGYLVTVAVVSSVIDVMEYIINRFRC
jgi:hypothetical protein